MYAFWWTTLWPLISILWSKDLWWLRIPVTHHRWNEQSGRRCGRRALCVPAHRDSSTTLAVGTRGARRDPRGAGHLVSDVGPIARTPLHPRSVFLQELRNFSDYAFAWLKSTDSNFLAFAGACMLLTLVVVVVTAPCEADSGYAVELVALVLGLLVMGVLSAIPSAVATRPITAGPRYYFLPYVVLGWVLFMIAVTSEIRWARIAATVIIVMSLLTLSQTFSRHDDTVSWSNQLRALPAHDQNLHGSGANGRYHSRSLAGTSRDHPPNLPWSRLPLIRPGPAGTLRTITQ